MTIAGCDCFGNSNGGTFCDCEVRNQAKRRTSPIWLDASLLRRPKVRIHLPSADHDRLLGWAARGFIFGILADYIGRVRALMFSIALYSLFTAMQGFRSVCSISVCLASSPASAPGAEIIVAFRCWPRRSAK